MKSIFPFIQKIHLRTCIYLIPIYVAFCLSIYQSYCRSMYLSPFLSIPTWAASGLNFAGRVRNSATVFSVVSIHLATDSCNQGLHMHKYLIREQLYNRHLPIYSFSHTPPTNSLICMNSKLIFWRVRNYLLFLDASQFVRLWSKLRHANLNLDIHRL